MSEIQSILDNYQPISLAAMDEVALMERVDEKFTVSLKDTLEVLSKISDKYYCLEIDGKRLFNYQTEYFDNENKTLFKNHQNGKLNRYKIRFRDYVESKKTFLEVKFKSNKGVTKKTRISVPFEEKDLNKKNINFLEEQTPYSLKDFEITIKNNFDRITLVNFQTKERVTIDLNLKFSSNNSNKELKNICIIEVKREKGNRKSEILSILKLKRIRPTRFSKYTIGSCILNPKLKYNNFKRKLLFINKISKNGIVWN